MKRLSFLICLGAFIWVPEQIHAYELATHGILTQKAYERSILNTDDKFLKDLGIDRTDLNPFGEYYYDVSGTEIRERQRNDFEKGKMPNEGRDFLTVQGWLLRGAIREDDAYGEDNPQDDIYNPTLRRPLHHFYDPVYDRRLTVTGIELLDTDIHTAPAWALGTTNANAFGQSAVPENNRRNHFTIFDAREAMYRALIGKGRNALGEEFDAAPTKTERDKYWATLFRALGDIVHLMQDMGQPQHTRNDQHAGKFPEFLTGHKSVYEAYLDCRATGGQIEAIDNYQDYYFDSCYPLTYVGYSTPVFTRYSDYFATRDGAGRGLAEYSNRNFFTFGTNLGSNDYPSPSNDRSLYNEETFLRFDSLGFQRTVRFLRGNVTDTRTGETNNVRLTTESAFDYFLGTFRNYSLNVYNYDDQADLLIPRAVAYSAGLIDYFFRGRIEAEDAHYTDAPPDSCGTPSCTGVELKVKNAIDPDTAPTEWRNEILYARTRSGSLSTLRIAYEYQDENGVTRYGTSDAVDLKLDSVNGDDDIALGKVSKNS
jgi:hypothetical protein